MERCVVFADMRISEIFWSRQGEGRLTGVESVFVRACGCNLRCKYCDTAYASWTPEGTEMAVEEIFESAEKLAVHGTKKYAVLTGGEPMLFEAIVPLSRRLNEAGWHITVETSGTIYRPAVCDLMSISPKLSNSSPMGVNDPWILSQHETARHNPQVIERLIAEYDYQFKFVIGKLADCDEVEHYLSTMPAIDRRRAMLMPQGMEIAELNKIGEWLEPLCEERGLAFCPRKHIEWFGPGRGK